MSILDHLLHDFQTLADPLKAKNLQRFFKTGKGDYGEGDQFLGIMVPQQRQLAKKYKDLSLEDIQNLLHTPIHEQRLTALFILVEQFKKSDSHKQEEIYNLYLANTKFINNWDLVDLSAPTIVGGYLWNSNKLPSFKKRAGLKAGRFLPSDVLKRLANSPNLWQKRIAILATAWFIKNKQPQPTLEIAKILLKDPHDLIHKAVGWMLREVGKNCGQEIEEEFLKEYAAVMSRTMLRYAIERFPEPLRQKYLNLGK